MATKRIEFDIAKQQREFNAQALQKTGASAGDIIEAVFTTPANVDGDKAHGLAPFSSGFIEFSKNGGGAWMTLELNGKTKRGLLDVSIRLSDLQPLTQYVARCTVDADVPADMLWIRLQVPVPFKTDKPRIPRG